MNFAFLKLQRSGFSLKFSRFSQQFQEIFQVCSGIHLHYFFHFSSDVLKLFLFFRIIPDFWSYSYFSSLLSSQFSSIFSSNFHQFFRIFTFFMSVLWELIPVIPSWSYSHHLGLIMTIIRIITIPIFLDNSQILRDKFHVHLTLWHVLSVHVSHISDEKFKKSQWAVSNFSQQMKNKFPNSKI